MARSYPTSLAAMQGITGMGEKKRAEFGATFAAAIAEHVATQGRQAFND
jgi:ATP-dependent DNA helicase RecQ